MNVEHESTTIRALYVIGGESTGKSRLIRELVGHQPAIVVPDPIRIFVDNYNRVPRKEEQSALVQEQIDIVRQARHQARMSNYRWVYVDSGALMTAIYSLQYFQDATLLDTAIAAVQSTDATIWCAEDIDWEEDSNQRDGPDARRTAQDLIAERLGPRLRLHRVSGSLPERTLQTLEAMQAHEPATKHVTHH